MLLYHGMMKIILHVVLLLSAEISEKVIFCNGGDRIKTNTPEIKGYGDDPRVEFKFAIGGDDKMNSSSWILNDYFNRQRKLLGI